MNARHTLGCTLPALALLAGCMRYQPAPVILGERAQALAAAQFDPAAIQADARRIAPDAAPAGLDRLALFAALLTRDPKIAQARAAIATAAAEARSSRHAVGPTFTLSTEYAHDPSASSPWLLGGAANLPLDRGQQRQARLDRADLAVLIARDDYAETVWSERMALRRALIDGAIAARQVAAGEAIATLHARQIAALERQAQAGAIPGASLSPYRALQAQERRATEDARSRQIAARAAIAGLLAVPVAALADQPMVWPEFDRPSAEPAVTITPALRLQAVTARADVLRALATYDQTDADVRLEIARQYPTISLGPGYTWERGLVKLPLAINLALPSFDRNRAAIRTALAKRDEAAAAIDTVLTTAQAEIDAALVERRAAMVALTRLQTSELPQLDAAAAQAEARLSRGQIARADWVDAQIAAQTARLNALDLLARVQTAEAALENALRRPIEGPETRIRPDRLEDVR
ncbi:TolC family protein [uncultured Sphingomonas sp.]|uniref:TolC family protein n=1 Tax=uncultured Sphingomonas sp. TaxID=158754 RepID=UPI0025FEFBB6|nr:TolC family protein [uncultured Sphingomonas sp.]